MNRLYKTLLTIVMVGLLALVSVVILFALSGCALYDPNYAPNETITYEITNDVPPDAPMEK